LGYGIFAGQRYFSLALSRSGEAIPEICPMALIANTTVPITAIVFHNADMLGDAFMEADLIDLP
jgi:hypothetical protein